MVFRYRMPCSVWCKRTGYSGCYNLRKMDETFIYAIYRKICCCWWDSRRRISGYRRFKDPSRNGWQCCAWESAGAGWRICRLCRWCFIENIDIKELSFWKCYHVHLYITCGPEIQGSVYVWWKSCQRRRLDEGSGNKIPCRSVRGWCKMAERKWLWKKRKFYYSKSGFKQWWKYYNFHIEIKTIHY